MAFGRKDETDHFAVRRGTFILLLVLVTVAFFGLIWDLLMACFWAALLAIVFNGVYIWLLNKFPGKRNLSASLTLIFILLVVITPIILVTISVVNESQALYSALENRTLDPEVWVQELRDAIPVIEHFFEGFGIPAEEIDERISEFGREMVGGLGELAVRYTQNAINVFIMFTLMLYLLYFFIRDGYRIVDRIQSSLPIGDDIEEQIFKRFANVARATLKGTLIVATVQGSIGGIAFAALGIPGATLWGVVMILLSLLPVGGSMFVWVPTAIILFASGEVTKAIILVIIGALFIGLIDNLLRPRLVSRDTQMPDYLVLLATLGGLALFGLSGFIVGPVIAALFVTCWEIAGTLFGGSER